MIEPGAPSADAGLARPSARPRLAADARARKSRRRIAPLLAIRALKGPVSPRGAWSSHAARRGLRTLRDRSSLAHHGKRCNAVSPGDAFGERHERLGTVIQPAVPGGDRRVRPAAR